MLHSVEACIILSIVMSDLTHLISVECFRALLEATYWLLQRSIERGQEEKGSRTSMSEDKGDLSIVTTRDGIPMTTLEEK